MEPPGLAFDEPEDRLCECGEAVPDFAALNPGYICGAPRCARTSAKTARNIFGVSRPVLVL